MRFFFFLIISAAALPSPPIRKSFTAPLSQFMERKCQKLEQLKINDFDAIDRQAEFCTDVSDASTLSGKVRLHDEVPVANATERLPLILNMTSPVLDFEQLKALPGQYYRSEVGIIISAAYAQFKASTEKSNHDNLLKSLFALLAKVRVKDRELFLFNVKLIELSGSPNKIPDFLIRYKHSKNMRIPIKASFYFFNDNEAILAPLFDEAKKRNYLTSEYKPGSVSLAASITSGGILGAAGGLSLSLFLGSTIFLPCGTFAAGGLTACAVHRLVDANYVYEWKAVH